MPSPALFPAAGATTVASAQLTRRHNRIVKDATFAPLVGTNGSHLRSSMLESTAGLDNIRVTIVLYPNYDRGDFIFVARNYITCRLVEFISSIDAPAFSGVITGQWSPLTIPKVLIVGQPVTLLVPRGGAEALSLEFDTTGGAAGPNQGEDRILVSLVASG